MAELSEADTVAVAKLRLAVADLLTPKYDTDFNLLRWLQGNDFDLDVIVPKLRKHLRFRRAWDLDNVKEDYARNPIVYKYWPYGILGPTGKDNNLIFIETMGRLDGLGVMKSVSQTQIMETRIKDMEIIVQRMMEQEARTRRQSGILFIMDMEGLEVDATLLTLAAGKYKIFGNFFAQNYAEVFRKFLLVNAPPLMYYVWRIVSPLLPEKTRKKVTILGADWKERLLDHALPSALPVHWGGTMVDPDGDPMCRSRVVVPPRKVPPALYWQGLGGLEDPGTLVLHVPAETWRWVTAAVSEASAVLSWNFVVSGDFGFGVFFSPKAEQTEAEAMEMVFPEFDVLPGPSFVPINESLRCGRAGHYRLRFGNQHAWFRNLTVRLRLTCRSEDGRELPV